VYGLSYQELTWLILVPMLLVMFVVMFSVLQNKKVRIASNRKMLAWGCVCILHGAAMVMSSYVEDEKYYISRLFWPSLIWSIVLDHSAKRLGYSRMFWITAGIGGGVLAAVPLWEHGSLWRNRATRAIGFIAFVLYLSFAAQNLQILIDPKTKQTVEPWMMGFFNVALFLFWLIAIAAEWVKNSLKSWLALHHDYRWKNYSMTRQTTFGLVAVGILTIVLFSWWMRSREAASEFAYGILVIGIIYAIFCLFWLGSIVLEWAMSYVKRCLALLPHYGWKAHAAIRRMTFGLLAVSIFVTALFWWWMRPAPETLTHQLWRECHDTLAYIHPDWDEDRLESQTKGCMDERLLRQRTR
jgi:hypothetical protein